MAGASDFFRDLQAKWPQIEAEIVKDIITVEANRFHEKNFRERGFTDAGFKPWDKRANGDSNKNRALLVKSAAMKGHAVNGQPRGKKVDFVFPLAYMKIHNEGGKIPITDKSRRFFWAMWYKTKNEFWKNMALSKKDSIDMPQRQYVGKSAWLEAKFNAKIVKLLTQRLNSL